MAVEAMSRRHGEKTRLKGAVSRGPIKLLRVETYHRLRGWKSWMYVSKQPGPLACVIAGDLPTRCSRCFTVVRVAMMLDGHASSLAGPVLIRGKPRPGLSELSNRRQGMTPCFMGAGELTLVDMPLVGCRVRETFNM